MYGACRCPLGRRQRSNPPPSAESPGRLVCTGDDRPVATGVTRRGAVPSPPGGRAGAQRGHCIGWCSSRAFETAGCSVGHRRPGRSGRSGAARCRRGQSWSTSRGRFSRPAGGKINSIQTACKRRTGPCGKRGRRSRRAVPTGGMRPTSVHSKPADEFIRWCLAEGPEIQPSPHR